MAWEITLNDNLNNVMGDNSGETEFTLMPDFISRLRHTSEWVIVVFNANSAIFQLHCILWWGQVNFQWDLRDDDEVALHSDTLTWFRANQFFSLMLHVYRRNNKYQFSSLWFDPTGAWIHDLPHPR